MTNITGNFTHISCVCSNKKFCAICGLNNFTIYLVIKLAHIIRPSIFCCLSEVGSRGQRSQQRHPVLRSVTLSTETSWTIWQFLDSFISLRWQMFGSCSRLACSELATQLRRTRELDLPSWPEQRIVVPTTHNTGKKPRCRREHIRTMFLKKDFTNLHTLPSLRDILQANHINILWTYTVPSDQLTIGASGKCLPHQDIDTSCINLWELRWTFSLKTAQPHRQHAQLNCLCFLAKDSYYVLKTVGTLS